MEKTTQKASVRYFSYSESGLRNGSFYRISKYGIGHFINGDYMGLKEKVPDGLREYTARQAKTLIPECCRLNT